MPIHIHPIDVHSLEHYTWLDAVRRRPGMYIGPTNHQALYYLLYSLFDNFADATPRTHQQVASLAIDTEHVCTFVAQSLPDLPELSQTSYATLLIHHLWRQDKDDFPVLAIINAVSSYFTIRISTGNTILSQNFEEGRPVTVLAAEDSCEAAGYQVRFLFSKHIFENPQYISTYALCGRLREITALTKNFTIHFHDARTHINTSFSYPDGIRNYLDELAFHRHSYQFQAFYISHSSEEICIEIAFYWCHTGTPEVYSYVNRQRTIEGGSHVRGFWKGLRSGIQQLVKEQQWLPENIHTVRMTELPQTIAAIIAVTMDKPRYASATREKLNVSAVENTVKRIVAEQLPEQLQDDSVFIRNWAARVYRNP